MKTKDFTSNPLYWSKLKSAILPSRISALSSGEFVGIVADDPTQKIEKAFYCQDRYKEIPVVRQLDNAVVLNFHMYLLFIFLSTKIRT
jgi:hypothetical protein